jgi:electron transfer flavoprotein-quinone oxidoreductase
VQLSAVNEDLMTSAQFDIVIVGAGAAGVTAAIALARADFRVAVVEAAAFPGAENWSGCVYFAENLAHPDVLGPDGMEALAWERRLVERGFFATDGHGLLGMKYRDPDAFRHCYTVLRPLYDHHLAQVALRHGVALLTSTTAESLIRANGRVIGICTNRGPLYANLVFLAEGDASNLVTREGYERSRDPRAAPKFLQGIKQVIELPPRAIEERFGVGAEQGVAYEMLLRNGTLRGKNVHLNMGGFLYTNRQSLSIGLVLPADNLREHFDGDPNLLMEWFVHLPALAPWFEGATPGPFGAKLIRGGGVKDVPVLVDDGLAIGGAASAVGVDFPYPNFTGPATAMGLLLARAARAIRDAGGDFTREQLQRHYVEPLQKTHYWQDVEFLRDWPGYVKKTSVFFGRNLDVALGSAYLWTRPGRGLGGRWRGWLKLVRELTANELPEIKDDMQHLQSALRMNEVVPPPSPWRLLLDGVLNLFRDALGRPRRLPPHGAVTLHYSIAGGAEPSGLPPAEVRRWFTRFAPAVAAAAGIVYRNDTMPLAKKLPAVTRLLAGQVSLLDFVRAAGLGLLAAGQWGLRRLRGTTADYGDPTADYFKATRRTTDLTPAVANAAAKWDARLAQLAYETVKASHIHVLWPQSLPDKGTVTKAGLWHVCPAHVYEARVSATGQLQVVVNFENCIKCETCWRTSDLVDWGRDGAHRFVYAVHSPVVPKLLADMDRAGQARPALPLAVDAWETQTLPLTGTSGPGVDRAEMGRLLVRLERKLVEFDEALEAEPRTIGRDRTEYLLLLARYANRLVARLTAENPRPDVGGNGTPLPTWVPGLLASLRAISERRLAHIEAQRYSWAAGDGRQMRFHHLAGLRRWLGNISEDGDATRAWLTPAEVFKDAIALEEAGNLDAVLPPALWRQLENQEPLSAEQDRVLRQALALLPAVESGAVHAPERKALLAELARRDPSLACRAASHLWARDIAQLCGGAALAADAERWARGDEWACFAVLEPGQEAYLVPAAHSQAVLALREGRLFVLRPDQAKGLIVRPVATLGLRGAGMAAVSYDGSLLGTRTTGDARTVWEILSAADLTSMAFGIADYLCRRATDHASSRVQFPGLFHDEEARDAIGKFGAIKKMVAELAAGRQLIETLDHCLSPAGLTVAAARQAGALKAVVAEVLGTAPGSIAYNAGQVFGGTGYSEDDTLSKLYRDAAAWRFLGPTNQEVFALHGRELLEGWPGATLPDEEELFAQLEERQALMPELQQIRKHAAALRQQLDAWQFTSEALPTASAQACAREAFGKQYALSLASKALLLRTHALLEHGAGGETALALLRVWCNVLAGAGDDFAAFMEYAAENNELPLEVEGPPITRYADFLAAPLPYNSGDFLEKATDPDRPRYVPEMIETDPTLAARNRELIDLVNRQFGAPRDGKVYERYLEEQHRPDAADLDFIRRQGWFRVPIPRNLGGEGRSKADYYLLVVNTHRLADAAISLTIQVNSSLGSTPVLVPMEKELPKAARDIEAFVADEALKADVCDRLTTLVTLFDQPNPRAITPAFVDLQKRLEETVLAKPVLRVLAFRFVQAWQEAGRRGKAFDLPGMKSQLDTALAAWQEACDRAPEMLDEIARRREAAELFCRWVASGQISAFALTEPSAGSDTARVATRAKLRSVPVEVESDGALHFVPFGGKAGRYLLDARRVEFVQVSPDEEPSGWRASYRYADDKPPAPLHFEDYDYETDARKTLWYQHGERRVEFSDVAQLRRRDGKLWYDYWELTGAKMWITNGRVMGVMALYAKTEEGVTGFIVDRHAEGLIVGKDEAKMGQNGSPTNELSLQSVRVPRENVIGLEGRGQVNALETLNVGRAGLAMSAMSQMIRLVEWSRAFARRRYGEMPEWVAWRVERMEEERFICEALALETIGRFEHKQTKSVRIESAVAKMLVSELFHHSIELAEEVHGLAGQTQEHLVEKRKRDARILNIYEGTNEIQRFLILKEVTELAASRGRKPPEETRDSRNRGGSTGAHASDSQALDALKARFRELTQEAFEYLGQQLWQNPNLQANCFLIAEAVAWLAAAESTLGRLTWLSRHASTGGEVAPEWLATGRRAFARCQAEVRSRLTRFAGELVSLRRGHYAPEIHAASLLFLPPEPESPRAPASDVRRALKVLVVFDAPLPGTPHPRVQDGELLEPYRVLAAADRAALQAALSLPGAHVEVATAASPAAAVPLREALSLGAAASRLVVSERPVSPDRAAAALARVLRDRGPFDLVLGGAGGADQQHGLLARLTAEALGVTIAGCAAGLAVRAGAGAETILLLDKEGQRHTRALPAAVLLEEGTNLPAFTTEQWLGALANHVELLPWPADIDAAAVEFEEPAAAPAAAGELAPQPLLPRQAGHLVLETAGLNVAPGVARAETADGALLSIEDVITPLFARHGAGPVIVAIVAAEADGKLRPTARRTLDAAQFLTPFAAGAGKVVLLVVPRRAEVEHRALAELTALTPFDIGILAVDGVETSDEVRCRVLAECWSGLENFPAAVVAEPWAEAALAQLATASGDVDPVALRVRLLDRHQGRLVAEGLYARGKLRTRQVLTPKAGQTCWIGLSAEAEVGAVTPPEHRDLRTIERWSPRLERFYGRDDIRRLLAELKRDTGLVRLPEAEFIIDVGFGVGNRDGYEAVIDPLERELRRLGVHGLAVGGSRKVTEELHLLPVDRQIGQSGVSVRPRVLLAIGVSGAPQHLNYIGPGTTIIAFNRDPECPLMTLNQRQAQPRVYPVLGDLFETVPALVACLQEETGGEREPGASAAGVARREQITAGEPGA